MTKISVIIPAFNEEQTVAKVIRDLKSVQYKNINLNVIVCDNNSTDNTKIEAEKAGAKVVFEARAGYGSACLRGIEELKKECPDIVLFIDADGSDKPQEWPSIVSPILEKKSDLVIGSRVNLTKGALLPHQRFGNFLATFLLNIKYKTNLKDLGPFRAIDYKTLIALNMEDPDYGWTVEMEIKALKKGFKIIEVPVSYGVRKGGESKVAGSIKGSFLAGYKILFWVFKEYLK